MNKRVKVTPSGIATIRVRFQRGGKKRPVFIPRPTLRELKSRLRGFERAARVLRGDLRRTSVGDEARQKRINGSLIAIAADAQRLIEYVAGVQSTEAPRLETIPALQPISRSI